MKARARVMNGMLVVLPALLGLLDAGATSAQSPGSGPCSGGLAERPRCFAELTADGRYQEVIDEIESREIGLAPYERYFLGISYFALAGRTGAASLRCLYTTRASNQLESFLVERQKGYDERGSFGTAEETKYTYVAARVLESTRATLGCEETGESLETLHRYGNGYLTGAVEELFFSYGTPGTSSAASAILAPARSIFNSEMDQLKRTTQRFVADVSRMETNHGLYQVEIAAANRDLSGVAATVNGWVRGDPEAQDESTKYVAIEEQRDPTQGLSKFTFTAEMQKLTDRIVATTRHYELLAGNGGEIAHTQQVVDRILREAGASSMVEYKSQRASTAQAAQAMSSKAAAIGNLVAMLRRTPSVEALDPAAPSAELGGISADWRAIEDEWKQHKPACSVSPEKWYCQ